MKGEKTVDGLRDLSDAELLARREDLRRQLFVVRSSVQAGGRQGPATKIRSMKKEVARILTIVRERELREFFGKPLL